MIMNKSHSLFSQIYPVLAWWCVYVNAVKTETKTKNLRQPRSNAPPIHFGYICSILTKFKYFFYINQLSLVSNISNKYHVKSQTSSNRANILRYFEIYQNHISFYTTLPPSSSNTAIELNVHNLLFYVVEFLLRKNPRHGR